MHSLTPILTSSELKALCDRLSTAEFVTVDTEFLRETTYWPMVCLIQIASTEEAALIDPLADGIDMQPLFDLMANEKIVKVFHAARQDIEIFYHIGKVIPLPLFDSQVAASVCGFGDSASYESLVARIVGAKVDKGARFTDWSRRPLSKEQLSYAISDVTHLRDIYIHLRDELDKRDRWEWLDGELAVLISPDTYIQAPEKSWKRLKMKVNKPLDFAILKLLAQWREKRAQSRNVPRGRVVKDDGIYELAQRQPRQPDDFDRLRTIPKGFGRSEAGREIVKIIQQARTIPKDDLPEVPLRRAGPSPKGPIGDLLRVLLKAVAENEGVAPRIIATSDEIDALVLDDNADIRAAKGWRAELFGKPALEIKHGKLALGASKSRVIYVPLEDDD